MLPNFCDLSYLQFGAPLHESATHVGEPGPLIRFTEVAASPNSSAALIGSSDFVSRFGNSDPQFIAAGQKFRFARRLHDLANDES